MFVREWEDFPKTYQWQEAIKFVQLVCKKNNIETGYLKDILNILIYEGNTTEDEVLTVAVLKNSIENKICSLEEIEMKYGKNVSEAVFLITKKPEEKFNEYINRIFEVEKFKYIRKIVVANELYNLRKSHKKETMDHVNDILCYEGKTNRELMKVLKEEIKKVGDNE